MIRAHTTAWVEAYNAGDADKIVAGYTEDAVLMPPDAPAATGHEAMKQYLAGDMAAAKAAGNTLGARHRHGRGLGRSRLALGHFSRERLGRYLAGHREIPRGVAQARTLRAIG